MAFWFSLKAKVTFYTILVFELLIFQILSLLKPYFKQFFS